MSSLIKISYIEKQAFGTAARFGKGIMRGARGTRDFYDKNIYRPFLNATRPGAAKIPRTQWSSYRAQNPAVGYKLMELGALGGLGYGGYQMAGGSEGIKNKFGDVGESVSNALKPLGAVGDSIAENKGMLAGASIPLLSLLSRGRIRPQNMSGIADRSAKLLGNKGGSNLPTRNPIPSLIASGGLGYGGYQFDNWNRADTAKQRASEDRFIKKILDRKEFYDTKGIDRNNQYGTFSPPNPYLSATRPQGSIIKPGY